MANNQVHELGKADQGHEPESTRQLNNTPKEKSDVERKREEQKSHPEDLQGPLHDEGERSGTDMAQ